MRNALKPMILIFLLFCSCKKKDAQLPSNTERKVRFELYTTKDFSNSIDSITFAVFIKKGNQVLWDSVFKTMRINEIPNATNKIIINKKVPNNDETLLKVGFNYTIKNVGNSTYFDAFYPENNLKVLNYNFQ